MMNLVRVKQRIWAFSLRGPIQVVIAYATGLQEVNHVVRQKTIREGGGIILFFNDIRRRKIGILP